MPVFREIIDQNVEILDEGEHDGWVDTRLRNGWRLGPKKDVEQREHHLLKPYAELAQQEKDKDRDSVRNYVKIIQLTDYRIATERLDG